MLREYTWICELCSWVWGLSRIEKLKQYFIVKSELNTSSNSMCHLSCCQIATTYFEIQINYLLQAWDCYLPQSLISMQMTLIRSLSDNIRAELLATLENERVCFLNIIKLLLTSVLLSRDYSVSITCLKEVIWGN